MGVPRHTAGSVYDSVFYRCKNVSVNKEKDVEKLFILSYKRAERLLSKPGTLDLVSPDWLEKTILVVREEEQEDYEKVCKAFPGLSLHVIPKEVYKNAYLFDWAETMDYILDKAAFRQERIVIMDDDLKLTYRPDLSVNTLQRVTHSDFRVMMHNLLETDYDCPVHGILKRGFNMSFQNPVEHNTGIAAVFGLYLPFFRQNKQYRFSHATVQFMGDRQFVLHLLTDGIKNRVFCAWCYDEVPNAPGGCSIQRTLEKHSTSAVALSRLYPEIVSLTVKTNLNDTRIGTKILWSKAYKEDEDDIDDAQDR